MISIGKLFSLFNHMLRKIHSVNSLNPFYELASDVTTTTAHIEDKAARGKVGDEVEHAVPRLFARRCVGLRNPVVRRADIGLRAVHTRMREWVPNKG